MKSNNLRVTWGKYYILIILLNLGSLSHIYGLSVSSHTPGSNVHNAAASGNISIIFNNGLTGSANASNVAVWGSISGKINGIYSVSGSLLTYNPNSDLEYGEIVTVTITTGFNPGDPLIKPYSWQFRVAPTGGNTFMRFNNQELGRSESRRVALGDIDGDGDLDAWVANRNSDSLFLNNGDGFFTNSFQALGTGGTNDVEFADLDQDGDLDAVLANGKHSFFDLTNESNTVWKNTNGTFSLWQTQPANDSRDVDLVDIDGDGDIDAVYAQHSRQNTSIYLNDGTGMLIASTGLTDGASSWCIGVGDLDNDGDPDLIVGADSGMASTIWMNSGTGNFTLTDTLDNALWDRDFSLADLNKDGFLDVYVAVYGSGTLSGTEDYIFLNNGSGGFTKGNYVLGATCPAGLTYPNRQAIFYDANNDGELEVYGAWYIEPGSMSFDQDSLDFLECPAPAITHFPVLPTDVEGAAAGDLDGDGDIDLFFVSNNGASREPNGVFLNTCASPPVNASNPIDVTYCELNPAVSPIQVDPPPTGFKTWWYDEFILGNLAQNPGTGSGEVFPPSSPGTYFVEYQSITDPACRSLQRTAVLFIDQSSPEFLISNPSYHTFTNLPNHNEFLVFSEFFDTTSFDSSRIVIYGEQTGKTKPDFSVSSSTIFVNQEANTSFFSGEKITVVLRDSLKGLNGCYSTENKLIEYRAGATQGFGWFVDTNYANTNSTLVKLGDLDGDGDLDAFFGQKTTFSAANNEIWMNDGFGKFSLNGTAGSGVTQALALVDIDNDEDLDAVLANSGDSLAIWTNDGNGNFTFSDFFGEKWGEFQLEFADIDSDGDLDALVGTGFTFIRIWKNDGKGKFTNTGSVSHSSFNIRNFDVGDIDADGDVDIWVEMNNQNSNDASKVYFNDGTGIFIDSGQLMPGSNSNNYLTAKLADFDNDGDLDIVRADGSGLKIWAYVGGQTFIPESLLSGSSNSTSELEIGDFNHDGKLDIYAGVAGASDQIWLNQGSFAFSKTSQSPGGSFTQSVDVGDLDEDGDIDIFKSTSSAEYIHFNRCGNPPPAPSNPINVSFCSNESVPALKVDLPANSAWKVSWFTDAQGVTRANGTTSAQGSNFVPANSGTNTYYAAMEVDSSFGCLSLNRVPVTIILNTAPSLAIMSISPAEICLGDSAEIKVNITGGLSPFTLNLDVGPIVTTINNYISGALIKISPPTSFGDTLQFTDANGCTTSSGQFTDSLVVDTIPVASFSGLSNSCADGAPQQLTGTPQGGVFSLVGSGSAVAGEFFLPTQATTGITNEVVYTFTDVNGCAGRDTNTAIMHALPLVSFTGLDSTTCNVSDSTTILTPSPSGGLFTGPGVFSIPFFIHIFSPDFAGPGTHTITYTFQDSITGCENSSSQGVVVGALPNVKILGLNPTYCLDAGPATVLGIPVGGSLTGTAGLFGNQFMPDSAGVGMQIISYDYIDTLTGCGNSADTLIYVNPLPTVSLFAGQVYCENEAEDTFFGSPSGGTFSGPGMTGSKFNPRTAGPGSHTIKYSFTDANGCSAIDSQTVNVNPIPLVSLSSVNTPYCANDLSDTLVGLPLGGTFLGQGISGNIFFPSLGQVGNSALAYTYMDGNGCSDTVKVNIIINVPPAVSFSGLGSSYCENAAPVTLTSSPSGGAFQGPGMNGNTFYPDSSGLGAHTITYTATANGCTNSTSQPVLINALPGVFFFGLQTSYCQGDPASLLTGSPAGGSFFADGNSASANYSPVDTGLSVITYTYTDPATNCSATDTHTVLVNAKPVPAFSLSAFCALDSIQLINNTTLSDPQGTVTSWFWDFGDGGFSTDSLPQHTWGNSGSYALELTATSNLGCIGTSSQNVTIGGKPAAKFSWKKICEGDATEFTDSSSGNIISWNWNFGDGSTDTVQHPIHNYANPNKYLVQLVVSTDKNCSDTLEREFAVFPLISSFPYDEGFDSDQGGWYSLANEHFSSWQWGIPSQSVISSAASSPNAWVTELDTSYTNSEHSFVDGPCFNLASLTLPMISFDAIYETEADFDGVVLQISTDGGENWQNLGSKNSGENWFNTQPIVGAPGGQSNPSAVGWAGSTDSTWIETKHILDSWNAPGNVVQLRFAFGSSPFNFNEGFGFDNVWIGERNRMVLVEHFTNSSNSQSPAADNHIEGLVNPRQQNVAAIFYHTQSPALVIADPFHAANPLDASGRQLNLGVNGPPWTLVDGIAYDSVSSGLSGNDLDVRVLDISPFRFDALTKTVSGGQMTINADLTYLAAANLNHELAIHLVAVERQISQGATANGQTEFEWVMRKMLPNAVGTIVNQSWTQGMTYSASESWTIQNVNDLNQLGVVAFVEDRVTGEILQSAYEGPSVVVGIAPEAQALEEQDLFVYPNPTKEVLNVRLSQMEIDKVQIYDLLGHVLVVQTPQSQSTTLKLNHLAEGIYLLRVEAGEKIFTRKIEILSQ